MGTGINPDNAVILMGSCHKIQAKDTNKVPVIYHSKLKVGLRTLLLGWDVIGWDDPEMCTQSTRIHYVLVHSKLGFELAGLCSAC